MMEAFFFYLGKVILCSGVMFLYYQLSLKDRTFHHYNRFYLLSAMVVSILLPLIKVEDFTIEVSNNLFLLISQFQNANQEKTINNDYIYLTIIFSALGVVSLYFLGKFLYGIFRIQQLKSQFKKETFEGVNFYQTDLSEAPFSYFKNLFWKNTIMLNSDVGRQILKHEMVHIEQKHSVDKIIVEIITSVFWFNPFFHIIKKEINLIHEYMADKKAVKNSDTKAFAQMLLTSHFSGTQLPATSPFLSSNLKKRLKMLQKPKTKFGYARRIFALPVLFTVAFAYMVNAKNKEIIETNTEIDKAAAEIKRDTVSPKTEIDQIVKLQQEKISKASEKLKVQSEKLKTLSEKSKEKSAELQKIAKEKGEKSYEFELKAKELKNLSKEMEKIADRDKIFNDLEFSEILPNGKNYTFRLNDNRVKTFDKSNDEGLKVLEQNMDEALEKMFNSKEFKDLALSEDKIKALKDKFNSLEFKSKFDNINKLYINGKDIFGPNTEELRKIGKGYKVFNTTTNFSKKELTKKEKRKLEKLIREKAETEKKLQEIRKQQRELQGNPWIFSVDAHAPKTVVTSSSVSFDSQNDKLAASAKKYKEIERATILKSNFEDDAIIYINGKLVTRSEVDTLSPKDISKIKINKSNNNGERKNEIRIETK
ncbi:M56 family metallopeptidase [Chryseobacterium echinoideorum]|uniref:M56 family metallopeptidase n=1 Tax=Chryseobacterium echinoideorum TaxID=1549648 RepID=UPI001E393EE2|nr:M56 family metallopeptidase [Chryseobacterium echinoideorum]